MISKIYLRYIVYALLGLLSFVYFFFVLDSLEVDREISSPQSVLTSGSRNNATSKATLKQSVIDSSTELSTVPVDQNTNSNIPFDIWLQVDAESVGTLPVLRSDIHDAKLVQYRRQNLLKIVPNSNFKVLIPQLDHSLTVDVITVRQLNSGNFSVKGKLVSDAMFSFVMTIGDDSMYATIGTPQGIFNISGNGSVAWVVPAKSLKRHINPEVLDFRTSVYNRPLQPSDGDTQ